MKWESKMGRKNQPLGGGWWVWAWFVDVRLPSLALMHSPLTRLLTGRKIAAREGEIVIDMICVTRLLKNTCAACQSRWSCSKY